MGRQRWNRSQTKARTTTVALGSNPGSLFFFPWLKIFFLIPDTTDDLVEFLGATDSEGEQVRKKMKTEPPSETKAQGKGKGPGAKKSKRK